MTLVYLSFYVLVYDLVKFFVLETFILVVMCHSRFLFVLKLLNVFSCCISWIWPLVTS